MADLLAVEKLCAGYGEAVVLSGVSLNLVEGEALALLGRNGMGKTTLINSIVGVTRYFGGKITLDGNDITGLRPDRRAHAGIGWVPQERNIFKSLTVQENLTAVARPGRWTPDKVYALFPRLAERRRNLGHQLSGGEQQMLAVGRALVGNPRLLLLDEPFEGLAPVIIDTLAAALTRLRSESNIATVLVEQQVEIALEMTEKVLVLDKGQIVFQGESLSLAADRERLASLVGLQEAEAPR